MKMSSSAAVLALLLGMPMAVLAQSSSAQSSQQQVDPITLPTVTVTAQKEPADVQKVPVSVTVVPIDWLQLGSTVSDAGIYSPNTYFSEFTARKLTNPRFRGIGASPANPSITTFIDGVPMLNANASNVELMDVEQVEFVRGPQSSLFGRNTLGGLINVASARPSLSAWSGQVAVPFGALVVDAQPAGSAGLRLVQIPMAVSRRRDGTANQRNHAANDPSPYTHASNGTTDADAIAASRSRVASEPARRMGAVSTTDTSAAREGRD